MCVLSIKVTIRKKSGNLYNDLRTRCRQHILKVLKTKRKYIAMVWIGYKKRIQYDLANGNNRIPENVQCI